MTRWGCALLAAWATWTVACPVLAEDGWLRLSLAPMDRGSLLSEFTTEPPGLVIRGQSEGVGEDSIETDRPDFTEASSIVGPGVLQLEMGYTYAHDEDQSANTKTRTHSGPETLLRYGVTELFELRLAWNYLWESTTGGGATTRGDGAEDLSVGTKIFLLEQDGWIPESSVILALSAPTGGREFSSGNTEFGTNWLYGWDLPLDLSLAGSTGYATGTDVLDGLVAGMPVEIEDRHGVWHQSVTTGIPLTERVRGFVEYFGFYYDDREESRPEHYLDGGFTFLVNNDLQFDIRAGHGLNETADDYFAGVGFAVRK